MYFKISGMRQWCDYTLVGERVENYSTGLAPRNRVTGEIKSAKTPCLLGHAVQGPPLGSGWVGGATHQ